MGEAQAKHLGAAALLLVAGNLASRLIGIPRESVLAGIAGVSAAADAYDAAFFVPDLLNYWLAGGALAIAFIPLYNRVRRREGEEAGADLVACVLGTLGFAVVLATLVLWVEADRLLGWIYPHFSEEARALAIHLTRIVLPAQIFFITGGILRAVLMAHGRFSAQAATGLIYNGAIIIGGLLTGTVEGFAWGVLVGAFVGNWLIPIAQIRRVGSIRLRVAPLDPRFRAYFRMALPLMLGVSLLTLDEFYGRIIGERLGEGTLALLRYPRRLMMAPVGILGQAIAAAALPLLSRYHAEGRSTDLNDTLLRTLRNTIALGVVAAAAVYVFSDALIELVYRYGRFDLEAAERSGSILRVMSLAIPAWVVQQVAVRAFYAREEMWRPMLLGTAVALAAIPLYLMLAGRQGVEGIALAGVIGIWSNALLTTGWARVRFGGPALSGVVSTLLRSAGVALVSAVVTSFVLVDEMGKQAAIQNVIVGGACFGFVCAAGAWLAGDAAMREGMRALLRRVGVRLPTGAGS
jgi:putative peptidoglycan lipid II flippase